MFFKTLKKNREIKEITEEEMKEYIKKIGDLVLLDVRSIQEYQEGHLEGAINIPLYELRDTVNTIIRNKNSVIIVYCTAGIRSKKAIKMLDKLGYKNLYNVKGGINI